MPVIRTLLLLFSTLLGGSAYGQGFLGFPFSNSEEATPGDEEVEIETDRDSFTPATATAGSGRTIFESAYSFIDNRTVAETHSYPEFIARRGVGDWFEYRLGWNYEVGGVGSPVSGNIPSDLVEDGELERESRVLYGCKARLNKQDGWIPVNTVMLQGFTPTSGETTDSQMSATYVFGWTLPNKSVWDSAIRYSTSKQDEDDFNVWAPSTVVKVPLGERWKVHAEYFGIFSQGRATETSQHYFSPGAHYLVTSNLEVGLRVGWGLNNQAPNFFSNAGFGWRY